MPEVFTPSNWHFTLTVFPSQLVSSFRVKTETVFTIFRAQSQSSDMMCALSCARCVLKIVFIRNFLDEKTGMNFNFGLVACVDCRGIEWMMCSHATQSTPSSSRVCVCVLAAYSHIIRLMKLEIVWYYPAIHLFRCDNAWQRTSDDAFTDATEKNKINFRTANQTTNAQNYNNMFFLQHFVLHRFFSYNSDNPEIDVVWKMKMIHTRAFSLFLCS